jgi:hypothetical protein
MPQLSSRLSKAGSTELRPAFGAAGTAPCPAAGPMSWDEAAVPTACGRAAQTLETALSFQRASAPSAWAWGRSNDAAWVVLFSEPVQLGSVLGALEVQTEAGWGPPTSVLPYTVEAFGSTSPEGLAMRWEVDGVPEAVRVGAGVLGVAGGVSAPHELGARTLGFDERLAWSVGEGSCAY